MTGATEEVRRHGAQRPRHGNRPPSHGHAAWRPMLAGDLPAVSRVAARVHPAYPEDDAVFAERLRLCAEGCFVFEQAGEVAGYLVSHPWRRGEAPALNSLLGGLPDAPGTWYLHDIALQASARGTGAAASALQGLLRPARAARVATLSLTAVNGSAPFWRRHGFAAVEGGLSPRLRSYGDDACFMVRAL